MLKNYINTRKTITCIQCSSQHIEGSIALKQRSWELSTISYTTWIDSMLQYLSLALDTVDSSTWHVLWNHRHSTAVAEVIFVWSLTTCHREWSTVGELGSAFGVPQGSCLGPLLFTLNSSKFFHVTKTSFTCSACIHWRFSTLCIVQA